MTIAENIARIRANMAAAAREAGRDPKEILLVGASKMNDAAACREAVAAGIDALGENRVQEMVQKLEQHAYDGAPLHFIGHLQRNKVKQVVGHVALIQSVGSLELLDEIETDNVKRIIALGHRRTSTNTNVNICPWSTIDRSYLHTRDRKSTRLNSSH